MEEEAHVPGLGVSVNYDYDRFGAPAGVNPTAEPVQNHRPSDGRPYDFRPLDHQDLFQGHRPTFVAPMSYDPNVMMGQQGIIPGQYFHTGYIMQVSTMYSSYRASPHSEAVNGFAYSIKFLFHNRGMFSQHTLNLRLHSSRLCTERLWGRTSWDRILSVPTQNRNATKNKRERSPEDENPRKRAKKDKDPKKVGKPNSFMCYRRAMVPRIKDMHPGIENGQISKIAGQWWKALSPAEKKPYVDQSTRLRRGEEQLTPVPSSQPAAGNSVADNADREEPLAQNHEARNNMPYVARQDEISTGDAPADEDAAGSSRNWSFGNWFDSGVASSSSTQGAEQSSVVDREHASVSDAGPVDPDLASQFLADGLNYNGEDPLAFVNFDQLDVGDASFEQNNEDLDRILFGP
ncbi:hypothetical protein RRF57_007114 [Xylaria bambusicola]|uniref:HMG box domain-containing protein n=1 Tax=Xylaria bambusicola TaxID=326684 RepID=A0AAN7YZI5_9PEZI